MTDLVGVLKALSSEPRLKILQLLKNKTLCVNAITKKLGITQSAVSQHLRILKEAGLVKPQKLGYWMHYSVNSKKLAKHKEAISKLLSLEEKQA
jgi:DNA-binding transcriptional ArsR family regulator